MIEEVENKGVESMGSEDESLIREKNRKRKIVEEIEGLGMEDIVEWIFEREEELRSERKRKVWVKNNEKKVVRRKVDKDEIEVSRDNWRMKSFYYKKELRKLREKYDEIVESKEREEIEKGEFKGV